MAEHTHSHNKKDVLIRGLGLHLLVYLVIGAVLLLLGVPGIVVFFLEMALIWGLIVMTHAYWYHK
ncbi:MAG: hypothetical protein HGA85_04460 [Nanoarchaeota archaeon]|nr:hypothetical protein [Nanoarchaeota archaeon]